MTNLCVVNTPLGQRNKYRVSVEVMSTFWRVGNRCLLALAKKTVTRTDDT